MTTVVISQPMLFPWPGFFELASQADILVYLDDVQFSKGSFVNRVQVKLPERVAWMTIPLVGGGSYKKINQLEGRGFSWKMKHRDLIRQSLLGSSHFDLAVSHFCECYEENNISDLLIRSLDRTIDLLGICPKESYRASSLNLSGRSWQRVLDIVTALGGDKYATAHGAVNYLDHNAFEARGVEVVYADYSMTPYPQRHGEFTPYVTILDLLAETGPQAAQYIRPRTIAWQEFLERRSSAEEPA